MKKKTFLIQVFITTLLLFIFSAGNPLHAAHFAVSQNCPDHVKKECCDSNTNESCLIKHSEKKESIIKKDLSIPEHHYQPKIKHGFRQSLPKTEIKIYFYDGRKEILRE